MVPPDSRRASLRGFPVAKDPSAHLTLPVNTPHGQPAQTAVGRAPPPHPDSTICRVGSTRYSAKNDRRKRCYSAVLMGAIEHYSPQGSQLANSGAHEAPKSPTRRLDH